jgi:hypothetical protein
MVEAQTVCAFCLFKHIYIVGPDSDRDTVQRRRPLNVIAGSLNPVLSAANCRRVGGYAADDVAQFLPCGRCAGCSLTTFMSALAETGRGVPIKRRSTGYLSILRIIYDALILKSK